MKLLTLNSHSLVDKNAASSAEILANAIIREEIDLIALQEVNQPIDGSVVFPNTPFCYKKPPKHGNYMLKVLKNMGKYSQNYNGVWYGFKESYGKYEEGVGIITRLPIEDTKFLQLSSGAENPGWKKRCAVGVGTPYGDFFSTHMGWWHDKDEPFAAQWMRLRREIRKKKTFVMGDFNAESHIREEGYDLVKSDGFYDTYCLADVRDEGFTVNEKIDGWDTESKKRIDYIFCNFLISVRSSTTIFDGKNYGKISDHSGVLIDI